MSKGRQYAGIFYVQKSNIIFSITGVESSGISTLEYDTSGLPSSAHRARRRIESFSPRLMLSSEVDGGRSGTDTPIISADSWRVETEDRRRWWELRFEGGTGLALGVGRESVDISTAFMDMDLEEIEKDIEETEDEMEPLREWERA